MTIRELKNSVPERKDMVKLPSAKALRESGTPSVLNTDDSTKTCLGEGCRAIVYENGLVLYINGKRSTVFRLHKCRETYGEGTREAFESVPCHFMLMLEGERRLEHNQDMREMSWNTSAEYLEEEFGYEAADRSGILDKLIEEETMEYIFSVLTERQRQVLEMFYCEQKRQVDIAEILGIERITVATILRTAVNKVRKSLPMNL